MKRFKIGIDTGYVGCDHEEIIEVETEEEAWDRVETLMTNHINPYVVEVDENDEEI